MERGRAQPTWYGGNTSVEDGLAGEELASAHAQESTRGRQREGGRGGTPAMAGEGGRRSSRGGWRCSVHDGGSAGAWGGGVR
jgi:hypothetical protein